MPGPSFQPTYSGAPTLDWVPSTRVHPPPADRPVPPRLPAAAAAPPRQPALSVREQLVKSASRFQARYRLKFRASAVQRAATVPVAPPAPTRPAPVRELAMPASITARRAPQATELPLMAPIGTSVSLAAPPAATDMPEPPSAHEPAPMPAEAEVIAAAPETAPEVIEAAPEPPAPEPDLTSPEPEAMSPAPEAPIEAAPAPEAPVAEAPATELASVVPSAPEPAPRRQVDWQVLLLAGPSGSGKSSIAQQLAMVLPKTALVKVEGLRGAGFSTVVAQTLPHDGVTPSGSGPLPAIWTGATPEARENAAAMVRDYCANGVLVIVEDSIETIADMSLYTEALAELKVEAATLLPSVEELERRDKMLPAAQQAGHRVAENRANVIRQLKDVSVLLDTSDETVESTAERILELLS
ncbi:MAG: phosphotransferase-like protein [Candidatus Sericytochromatia bacterium]